MSLAKEIEYHTQLALGGPGLLADIVAEQVKIAEGVYDQPSAEEITRREIERQDDIHRE